MNLKVFTDGGARGNPGPAAAGWVVKTEKGEILARGKKYLGKTTNNVAEYQALYLAFLWLLDFAQKEGIKKEIKRVDFFLDSSLVVSQVSGVFKIKARHLIPLISAIKEMEKKLGKPVSYHYVPREKNKEADALVNEALDEQNSL